MTTNYLVNPLGLDKAKPRFSYEVVAEDETTRGLSQVDYRILIGNTGAADGSVWDSGIVASNASIQLRYGGPSLKSGTMYTWAVSVTVKQLLDDESWAVNTATSPLATFSTGMFSQSEWTGSFIGMPPAHGLLLSAQSTDCPWFRKSFALPADALETGKPTALLYVASIGYHELYVNGVKATDRVLLPSTSHLPNRVLYRTYDVTGLLLPGQKNAVGIWVAPGWDNYQDMKPNPGVAVMAELHAGPKFKLVTDAAWKVHESTTTHIGGDSVDDSKDIPNWNTADLDDSKWSVPVVVPLPPNVIISADSMEGSRRHSTIAAAAVAMQPTPPPPPPPTPSNEPCGKDCMCGLAAELPPSSNQTVGTVQPHTVYTSFTLKCAPGQRIKSIDFASYGTPTGTCGNFAINPKCHANSSLSVVKGLCEGKLACTVGAANSLFKTPGWDMCPDVLKHLRVEASGC
eukprot:gene22849-21066_t